MLKPPISRMGGKSKLRKQIIDLIPEHTCYAEAFFGAGWVYFGKEHSKVEAINDIDSELVNLFKMIKCHDEEIIRLLQYEVYARDWFNDYLNQDPKYLTEIQRAIRYLYIISCSFGSKGNHFGYGATKKPTSKIFIKDFTSLRGRLENTYIENLDFKVFIDKYDRTGTFFFCDPPYYNTAGYSNKFIWENHVELFNKLSNLKGKFLLTINDCKEIQDLYKDFNIVETEVLYTVSNSKNGIKKNKELIITNY